MRTTAVAALLLMAVSFAGADLVIIGKGLGAPGGSARYGNAGGGNRQLYSGIYNGNPYAGYPNTGYTTQYMHYMRITLTAAAVDASSFGKVKALYR